MTRRSSWGKGEGRSKRLCQALRPPAQVDRTDGPTLLSKSELSKKELSVAT